MDVTLLEILPMDLSNPAEFKQLSELVKGVGSDTRLALLIGLDRGYSANEIAEFLEMTRGGLQNNIYKMIDAGLIYRPGEENQPTYRLTPLGRFFAQFFATHGRDLLDVIAQIEQTENTIREDLQHSPLSEELDQNAKEKLVHTKTWNEIETEIRDRLSRSRLQLEEPIFELLTEDEPIQANTTVVLAHLAARHPETIVPALPELLQLVTAEDTSLEVKANALLAVTAVIEGNRSRVKQVFSDMLYPQRSTEFQRLIEVHPAVVLNFVRTSLATFAPGETDPDQIFETVDQVRAPKPVLLALHGLLFQIVREYRRQNVLNPGEWAEYQEVDVSLTAIHKSKTEQIDAIRKLAQIVARHESEIEEHSDLIVPYQFLAG